MLRRWTEWADKRLTGGSGSTNLRTPKDDGAKEARENHLLLDPRPAREMENTVLAPMMHSGMLYWFLLLSCGGLVALAGATWVYQMWWGIGITGLRRPAMWALYIADFVYFIGIGVAGTFISAVLRVLRFQWRMPITRAAETLTVFAVATASLFPLIHLGRTWKFYWMMPYPNQRQIWPSFHSPIIWDMMAMLTYLVCSVLFAWLAIIPDLAIVRDHIRGWRRWLSNILALGWRGTEHEWHYLQTALTIFSYAIIPVMILMHSIVGWDFAVALQPGWHSTVFGPYFVAGALLSGAAAVLIVLVLVRQAMHLEYMIRPEHLDGMCKLLLVFSLTWAYLYFNDYLVPWYGQEPSIGTITRSFGQGPAAPLLYLMLFGNVVLPLATFWSRRLRRSLPVILIVSIFVNIGMYVERILIVAVMLGYNELPFSWGAYLLRLPETIITLGAFGLVGFLFLIFVKVFPIIPIWEVQEGQVTYGFRQFGQAAVPTRVEHD